MLLELLYEMSTRSTVGVACTKLYTYSFVLSILGIEHDACETDEVCDVS